jgi:hypothetical protein
MMREAIKNNLDELEQAINAALAECSIKMMGVCQTMPESIDAMDKMVDVVSDQQQRTIYALIGACLESEGSDGKPLIAHHLLRQYVHAAGDTFKRELVGNMSHNLRLNGHIDIMSPNQAVVDEILGASDDD